MQLKMGSGNSKQLIVLVTGTVFPRMGKIGYGLKYYGWHVVILYRNRNYIHNMDQCFDEMHQYESAEEAVQLARRYKPLVYHVFCVWDYDIAIGLIKQKIGPLVVDNYDTLAGMLKPEFLNERYPMVTEKEKFCIESADGLCCRDLMLNYVKKNLGYAPKGKTIFFPELCWNFSETKSDKKKEPRDKEIHLVYAGGVNVEKMCRNDPYQMQFKNGFFLDFGLDLASAGLHFHLYPQPNICSPDEFENVFSEYLEAETKTPFFHIHRPLPVEKLIEEISSYDLGIEASWLESETIGAEHSLPIRNYYGISSKLSDYIEAGLGLVLSDNFWMRRWMFQRFKIVRTAYLDFVKERILATPPEFYHGLREKVMKARDKFSITRHVPRLTAFYLSVAKSAKKRKIFVNTNCASTTGYSLNEADAIDGQQGEGHLHKSKGPKLKEISDINAPPPHIFSIETMLGCNLKCPECAVGGGMITRPKGFMSFDNFKHIADKIRPYCKYLYLHIWGEPLLNRDIIPIIKYASTFAPSNISTNGMCLDMKSAEELITSGVNDILFSIDGVTQETYRKYRVGGDVMKAINSLKMLQYFNQKHGNKVEINPQFIVFKHNQHEMETFRNLCRSFGLKALFKVPYIRKNSKFENSDLPEYARRSYADRKSLFKAMSACPDPKDVFTVLLDGSVVACCYDHNKETSFGNIFKQSVMDIWNSKELRAFRQKIQSEKAPAFCQKNCLYYVLDEPVKEKPGKRAKKKIDTRNLQQAIEYARDKYRAADYPVCFDAYEQLVDACPKEQIELLVEIYHKYLPLLETSRYQLYQSRFFEFGIKSIDKVLDVGSGHLPFPFANHLADLSLEDDSHGRAGAPFKHVGETPVYECSIEDMPFEDKQFDFVYCSHVLEHVNNPEQACKELMRIGRRGFIETPGPGKDLWLNSAHISNHRWSIRLRGDTLIFREYKPDEIIGLNCPILMDMHCSPQTPREKAFSALLILRADLVNTMLYWEDGFKIEVHRNEETPISSQSLPQPVQVSPAVVESSRSDKSESCIFINTYYSAFIESIYQLNPGLANESYKNQKQTLLQECFGDSDFYSHWLAQRGISADDLIVNCRQLQASWCLEHNCNATGQQLVLEQIRHDKPSVVYIQDMNSNRREFLSAIRPFTRIVVGQIATPVTSEIPFDCYDIVFSSFPHYVQKLRAAGIKSYYQPLAFDPRVLEKIKVPDDYKDRSIACSFVGGISSLHVDSYRLLEVLAEKTPIEFWGYGANTLAAGSSILPRHHGEAWGKQMFQIFGNSRITVNRHGEVAENYANNMRLFEATGCGTLLITDYKDNLNDLFEIGTEIVVYRSHEECAELINYYLAHPKEAEAIAKAGQIRTLRSHTYELRMAQTSEILKRHLRYKQENGSLEMPNRISDGHQTISKANVTSAMASAWKNPMIPLRQRALVQNELDQMYHGKVAASFKALADILSPILSNGESLLEIGCASGYYYEILEYLLNKRIAYTGVDYSEAMIEMATDYYPAAEFFASDGANMFFEDRSFDIVISSGVLLHVPNWKQHVSETVRVADKFIVVSRTPVCKNMPTKYMKKYAYGVETVELLFNETEILREFQRNGLELVNSKQYHSNTDTDEHQVTYLFKRR